MSGAPEQHLRGGLTRQSLDGFAVDSAAGPSRAALQTARHPYTAVVYCGNR